MTRYAVISDIHGNAPALGAVLRDARAQGAQGLLLLGDYYLDAPYPNEVCEMIRSQPDAVIIAGNKETRLTEYETWPPAYRARLNLAPTRWNLDILTPDNLRWLKSMPPSAAVISPEGLRLFLDHNPWEHFCGTRVMGIKSSLFAEWQREEPFDHQTFLTRMRKRLDADETMDSCLRGKPPGVYLFGHTHLQWWYRRGGTYLVNPGSCGQPLDFDTRAPYTLLETDADGVTVRERRVAYDVERAARETERRLPPLWNELGSRALRTAAEVHKPVFIRCAELTAAMGEDDPFCDAVWRAMAAERGVAL